VNVLSSVQPSRTFALDVSARGYQVLFRTDETNRCPGCGHAQWLVGRITAECCFCGTALALAEAEWSGMGPSAAQKAVSLHVIDAPRAPRPTPAAPTRSAAKAGRDKRREERMPANGRVLGLFIDGSPHPFAIQNTSAGGVKGEALPGIADAASLVVELEDGTRLPAVMKWTDGESVGLAFVTD
jgi:hypothetical protein